MTKTRLRLVAVAAAIGSLIAVAPAPAKADVEVGLGLIHACVTVPTHTLIIGLNGASYHIAIPGLPRTCGDV